MIDNTVLQALYSLRDPAFVQIFSLITEFGDTLVIGGISLAAGVVLLVRKDLSAFAGLCISVAGTVPAVFLLKEVVARARPDVLYQAYLEHGFSFPSGHAAFAVALYGFLMYLLWPFIKTHRWAGASVGFLNLLIVTIIFSRLYLGVHYLSDVLAGALVGGTFLAAGIYVSERLKRSSIWS